MKESIAELAGQILYDIRALERSIDSESKADKQRTGHCGETVYVSEILNLAYTKAQACKIAFLKKALLGKRKELENLK